MDPYERHYPMPVEGELVVERPFRIRPGLKRQRRGEGNLILNNNRQQLYAPHDQLSWAASNISAAQIHAMLSERVLVLALRALLEERNHKIPGAEYGVLEEKASHRGKGYVATHNNDYLLRFKGPTNFVLLKKDHEAKGEERYKQEKFGYQATELDGLAYFDETDLGGKRYLIVGEASVKTEFGLNAWESDHRDPDVISRVFTPLRELFHDHELIYFVLAPGGSIWNYEREVESLPVLRKGSKSPTAVYNRLRTEGINTIFSPLPTFDPPLEEIADELHKKLPFVKGIINALDVS